MTDRSNVRHDWLNLIEVSGPFLAVPVLEDVFPQGLEGLETSRARRLRNAYDEWRVAVDGDDPDLAELHAAWIDEILTTTLEMDASVLRRGADLPDRLRAALPEHGVTLVPDLALVDPSHGDAPLLLVHVLEPDVDLGATRRFDGLAATPADRMVMLLRFTGSPVGLITNGERWMLVHAPVGSVASFASWYARLWGQEPETLRAFVSLLGIRRFFGPEDERLPALYERSLKHQDDVTDALGEQVRRAVEVLVQAVDRADQDRNRELLRHTEPRKLYEAALTVMMRLVFLLAAEERGLLLLNDERYDAHYALSTLRMQLRGESEEILERRRSAWSRLLALFRAVYGGIEHPALRLPPLGGSLFDPDRYPFLEGRLEGTSWRTHPAEPLPIDDRTVLLLLEAIQTFEGRTLSYRALDVEQIGHVYEGLLERTVKRIGDVTLELDATAKAKDPRVALGELESAALEGRPRVVMLLEERSQRSASAIRNALDRTPDERLNARLLTVCRGDVGLRDRIVPYAHLLRTDPWNYPLVHHTGAFVVVLGADRRETGTHYTPKSLTEKIVEETLTPLVYRGPAEGVPREAWELKRPDELLDLKVCDPAMGSAAFLVQVCRFLSERLVEAWAGEEAEGRAIDVEGRIHAPDESFEPLPTDVEERAIVARRLVAERCLYGVDLNPLAVELAKLSLWLTTLAKGRPFNFLDHHLKSGDSLLGISDLRQLTELRMKPERTRQLNLFGQSIERAVDEAVELRQLIDSVPVRDIRDVEEMAELEAEAREKLQVATVIADAFIGTVFAGRPERETESRLATLAADADRVVRGDAGAMAAVERRAVADLSKDAPDGRSRRPFHWPLEFPEVFASEHGGFDVFVGNPPFLGGQKITGAMGTVYREHLVEDIAEGMRGSADFVTYFFLRIFSLLSENGVFGLIAVNTIAEGDTREVGLDQLLNKGGVIIAAYPNEVWPGTANVVTSRVHMAKSTWGGMRRLGGRTVGFISSHLGQSEVWSPKKLSSNVGLVFQGSIILGDGFLVDEAFVRSALEEDPDYRQILYPYLIGREVNQHPEHQPGRSVINFFDWEKDQAERFHRAFAVVEREVRPEREKQKDAGAKRTWWLHLRPRPELYHAIGRGSLFRSHPVGWDQDAIRLDQVIVFATGATKYPCFTMVPNEYIYANTVCVVASDSFGLLGCLSSDIHAVWAWQQGSRMKQDLRYTHGDVFETFPLPPGVLENACDDLARLGEELFTTRREVMRAENKGMTAFYNDLHDPSLRRQDVARCREIQAELNRTVLAAYGMDDVDLDLGFHEVGYLPTGKNTRFTISENARIEMLRRLAELNRQRYEGEVAQGLHEKTSSKMGTRKRSTRASTKQTKITQQTGFDFGTSPAGSSTGVDDEPAQAVMNYLGANPGWHAKADVLRATGLTDGQWNATIGDLVIQGHVERKGEKRGTRYRAKSEHNDSRRGAA